MTRTTTTKSSLVDLLFNDGLVGRCLVAPDGTVLRANSEWLRSTGFDLDQVLGADIIDLFPGTRDMALAMHVRARAGRRVEVPRHAQVVNGRETWWEGSIEPVAMEGGTGLLITAREVSGAVPADGRHDAELLEHGDPFCELDREFRIIRVNAAHERVNGHRREQILGRTHWDVWPESADHSSPYWREYHRCVEERIPVQFDAYYAPLDVWTSVSAHPTPQGGVAIFWRNDTARMRAEAALRATNERLTKVLEVQTVGVMFWDLTTGRMTDANDTLLELLGYSRRELEAGELTWQKLTPPEYVEMSLAEIRKFEVTGRIGPYEKEYLHKDGTRQWFVFAGSSLGGNAAVEFCVDISSRKRAENDLRETEARYRTLFDSIDEGFCVIDLLFDETGKPNDYRFVEVNPAFEQHTGLKNAKGKRVRELVPDQDEHWFETYGKVATTGKAIRFQTRGEALGRDYDVYAFRVGAPEQRRVAVLFNDVSNRKRAEVALRASEERLRADVAALIRMQFLSGQVVEGSSIEPLLQETVDTAVAMMAADMGNMQLVEGDTLRIVAHSGYDAPFLDYFAAAEKVASTCGEATRRGERVVVPDVEASPIFAGTTSLEVLRTAGVRAVQSTPLRTRSGRLLGILTTQWKVPHAPDDHDLSRLDLLARQAADLIDVKQSQDALREANERLRVSDQRKTEFLAMLSHELRNPLAPIRNSIYLLEHAASDSEQAIRAREVVRRQTEHLTRLVDDLLDVTRISHGKIPLERRRVDLREIARKTTDDLHPAFTQAGIKLRVDTSGPAWIDADGTRIAQVLTNLLNNAMKFTPSGGTVRVSVAANSGSAELCVVDDGVGMDPKHIEHMFEPFAQADQSLARTKGGLGLGLALVKSIVELHGGMVQARSDGPGRGAEFLVRIPLADAGPEEEKPRQLDIGITPQTVLVIEDNLDGAQSLADILEMYGHRVRVARDGRSGIALARDVRPDIILCDIGLPDVNGYDVARTLRSDGPLRNARIVALTGYAQPEDQERARAAGFDAHLAKPVELDKLMTVLANDS